MSDKTGIEWTDATWWPLRDQLVDELRDVAGLPRRDGFTAPLRWRKPRRAQVRLAPAHDGDLFHEAVPDEWIDRVFAVMALCPQHTFQILTKRPERMAHYLRRDDWQGETNVLARIVGAAKATPKPARFLHPQVLFPDWPLPNVWLGVSVEDQATADERVPLLLQTPAAVRFVSYEPALGAVDFARHLHVDMCPLNPEPGEKKSCGGCLHVGRRCGDLDWIIVGGESGPGARPFDVAWARSTIAQCRAAGVACFVKQLGADPRETGGEHLIDWPGADWEEAEGYGPSRAGTSPAGGQWWAIPLRDRKGGDMAEWPEDLRVREFPRSGA